MPESPPAATVQTVASLQLEHDDRLIGAARLTINSVDESNRASRQIFLLTQEQFEKLEADMNSIQGAGS